mmetsp:Transcript_19409/g.48348  ORF Transcript_19409/g.48348 Transcript_19409/m.48348 type:complete len:325 (-) Transcript_19409:39-1013(-)
MARPSIFSETQSGIMYKERTISMATEDDDTDKKRRQLLIRSAKRPFKRSRIIQQQSFPEAKRETDTISTASLSSSTTLESAISILRRSNANHIRGRQKTDGRRVVSFDTKYNQTILVPSHRDLNKVERRAYYFQRDEYIRIKRKIHRLIEFLKSPSDSRPLAIESPCIRGLECLAEDAVNDFKKRVQKTSKSAVFQFQEKNKRSTDTVALAEVYKRHTSQCESIARRWGYFDSIDAGYDPTASSAVAVSSATAAAPTKLESTIGSSVTVDIPVDNNASLSSLSYDGDDGEDENESNDDFNPPPVVNAEEPANAFDSLPEGLFNF